MASSDLDLSIARTRRRDPPSTAGKLGCRSDSHASPWSRLGCAFFVADLADKITPQWAREQRCLVS
jgi:hypothetical protein